MKAIILAAGIGTRLNPKTNSTPKCLIEVNGKSILKRGLEHLDDCGIEETIIVVGYMSNKIIDEVGDNFGKMKVTYVKNCNFSETNNVYSLWLAREHLKNGCILIEGDVLFEKEILLDLLDIDRNKSCWVVDRFLRDMDGCMLTAEINSLQIQNIQIVRGKLEDINDNYFKSVGILKITPEFGNLFSQWLDEFIRGNLVDVYYDLVLAEYINEYPIYVCEVNGLRWAEVDDLTDLKKAEEIFSNLE